MGLTEAVILAAVIVVGYLYEKEDKYYTIVWIMQVLAGFSIGLLFQPPNLYLALVVAGLITKKIGDSVYNRNVVSLLMTAFFTSLAVNVFANQDQIWMLASIAAGMFLEEMGELAKKYAVKIAKR